MWQRLTPGDLMMLWPEDFGWREDMGALAVVAGTSIATPDGAVRLREVRDFVEGRLAAVHRFRQRLLVPRWGLGRPLWVDASDFDICHHVNTETLRDPADLLTVSAAIFSRPFDWSRPLWQMWLLSGLPEGRMGLLIKLHHTMADAQAGLALLGAFLDVGPDPKPGPKAPERWRPEDPPTPGELLRDNVTTRWAAVRRGLGSLRHPAQAARRSADNVALVRRMSHHEKAPTTSLNRPVLGAARVFATAQVGVAAGKAVAHDHGGTLNDVLLCAVAGGLRQLLQSRGEPTEGRSLIANVPVSRHRPGEASGNEVGTMFVPLPVGKMTAGERLAAVAQTSAVSKATMLVPPTSALLNNRRVQRMFWRGMRRQRYSNVYVSNVPGPPIPLYFAGCRLERIVPLTSGVGNVPVGVGAISYAGELIIAAAGDEATSPDIAVLAQGIQQTLDELVTRAGRS
ncbi:MAG: wax ester/triacylglycerol synthase family O-acyltransferase [Candidatus Nanopelagicales bacterium]